MTKKKLRAYMFSFWTREHICWLRCWLPPIVSKILRLNDRGSRTIFNTPTIYIYFLTLQPFIYFFSLLYIASGIMSYFLLFSTFFQIWIGAMNYTRGMRLIFLSAQRLGVEVGSCWTTVFSIFTKIQIGNGFGNSEMLG